MSIENAQELIRIEAAAISQLVDRIDENFVKAVDMMMQCQGRVVITGMGKTGIIGRKIAATLSSTGTPSIFMHSAEAVHGDLGQVTQDDILIIISSSGRTEETVRLLPLIKRTHSKIIAFTGDLDSELAKHSDVVLNIAVEKEGCPLGLAPMASTTATLVMGDALATCLIHRRKFKKEDFAFFHPGGSLGQRLLVKVEDLMRQGSSFAKASMTTKVKDVLIAITKARCGSACVFDDKDELVGIFTDGDLRRHIELGEKILDQDVSQVMTHNPTAISKNKLAVEALEILRSKKIDELPVVDDQNKLVGLLDVQDILKAGIV